MLEELGMELSGEELTWQHKAQGLISSLEIGRCLSPIYLLKNIYICEQRLRSSSGMVNIGKQQP